MVQAVSWIGKILRQEARGRAFQNTLYLPTLLLLFHTTPRKNDLQMTKMVGGSLEWPKSGLRKSQFVDDPLGKPLIN